MNPTFEYENKLWSKGLRFVGGADEVGRGAFAGPVVASVVVFDPLNISFPKDILVRDSKKMTPKQRKVSSIWIKENTYWGMGEASVSVINRLGIGKASEQAFRKATDELLYHLPKRIEHLLLDAFFIPYMRHVPHKKQTAIIKGDSLSCSIAAASIVAKVYRDELMKELGSKLEYKKYKWPQNAGYGTQEHRDAILMNGITRHHRRAYVRNLFASQEQLNA